MDDRRSAETLARPTRVVREEAAQPEWTPGTWCFVEEEHNGRWLGCVTHLGSNYLQVTGVGGASQRIHDDERETRNIDRYRDRYEPFTRDSVYFDDIAEHVKEQVDHHNRIVLILQGLLDRSAVFAPHPRWTLWTEDGLQAAIRLVYDDSRALVAGEQPDFEAYRARLNSQLREGSLTVGQQDWWERREAEKYNARYHREFGLSRHRPYGNPGPGELAVVARVGHRTCRYRWTRSRLNYGWPGRHIGDPLPCTADVPTASLLNVSAYQPGDFRQFFNDPRTRAEYLQWAPLLLEAEEWWAGNRPEAPVQPERKTKRSRS